MGYHSLKKLLQLPLAAIEFAANGGTNFAKLELLRGSTAKKELYNRLTNVGHSAEEMVNMIIAQRAYELNAKAIQASDDMMQVVNGLRR